MCACRFHIQNSGRCDGAHFSRCRRLHARGNIQCVDGAKGRGWRWCLEFVGSEFIGNSNVVGHSVAHSKYFTSKWSGQRVNTHQFVWYRIHDTVAAVGRHRTLCCSDIVAISTQENCRRRVSRSLLSYHHIWCFTSAERILPVRCVCLMLIERRLPVHGPVHQRIAKKKKKKLIRARTLLDSVCD